MQIKLTHLNVITILCVISISIYTYKLNKVNYVCYNLKKKKMFFKLNSRNKNCKTKKPKRIFYYNMV